MIKRKRDDVEVVGTQVVEHDSSAVAEEDCSAAGPNIGQASATIASKAKTRLYFDSYLSMGFTWCGDGLLPKPKCVVCGDELSNESMVPSKLKRHFSTRHSNLSDKPVEYFKRLLLLNERQSLRFQKKIKLSDKAQEASYLVAELVAKDMKPHTVAESLILPACCAMVRTMLGPESEAEIKKIPLSDNTISRRIDDMSADIEKSVFEVVKKSQMYALQADESTDISGKAQLLVFIRYIADNKIVEQFLCCKELQTATGQEVFNTVNKYLQNAGLSWASCVGVCTDGAPSMLGTVKGFVTLVKNENKHVITTHCFLHREALVAKTLGNELKSVMDEVVKMVNFIKSRPLKSRLFATLCNEMGSRHEALLLHTEVRWLSRGRVLSRVHELREEMLTFFTCENKFEFCDLLADDEWCVKLGYLADIFGYLNKMNISMQGRNENILSSTDKVMALLEKIQLWNSKIKEGNLNMFPSISNSKDVVPLICEHLDVLEKNIEKYFPNIAVETYDWVRNPFIRYTSNKLQLSLNEEEELTDIRNDGTLNLKHQEGSLQRFWIELETEYPLISKKALTILLQFSTSYLCELGFSTLTNIKTKKRARLQSVEEEMRVCLSNIAPNIQRICSTKQSQISH